MKYAFYVRLALSLATKQIPRCPITGRFRLNVSQSNLNMTLETFGLNCCPLCNWARIWLPKLLTISILVFCFLTSYQLEKMIWKDCTTVSYGESVKNIKKWSNRIQQKKCTDIMWFLFHTSRNRYIFSFYSM